MNNAVCIHKKIKKKFLPSDVTTRLLAKSALLPTNITARCAIFSDVHNDCITRSAIKKLS